MPGRLQGTLLTCPVGYCPIGVQGTVLGITVDLSALPYLLRPFLGPHRADVPGRLVPVGSDCASWRRAVSRGSVHSPVREVGQSRKRALFLLGRAFRSERQAGVGSKRCSSLARASGRRLDHPSGLSFKYLGQPKSCALLATLSGGLSLCWIAGPRGTPGL